VGDANEIPKLLYLVLQVMAWLFGDLTKKWFSLSKKCLLCLCWHHINLYKKEIETSIGRSHPSEG